MPRTYAADSEEVSKRIAELEAERKRQLSCTCRRSDDGSRIESAACAVHGGDPGALGLYWPPSAHLSDNWEELREQIRRAHGPASRVLP